MPAAPRDWSDPFLEQARVKFASAVAKQLTTIIP